MNQKISYCKGCGKEIPPKAIICLNCGTKNKQPLYKKWWFWLIIAGIFVAVIAGSSNDSGTSTNTGESNGTNKIETQQGNGISSGQGSAFAGDCGISAIAEMGTDIIGQPTVSISITNNTKKDIRAIKFYAIPLNVYGEELKGIFTQNDLITDDTIAAGKTETRTWQFLDDEVKTVKLYVYSVYFSDGSEWGNKEATKSVIIKNGIEIVVEGISEE